VIKTKGLKINKLMWAPIILLGALMIFAYFILYNDGVALKKTTSTGIILKIKDIQEKGGEFEITQKDIDEVISLYFSKPKNQGGVTVQGVNIEMLNDKLLIKASVSYKKLNLLFSSRGKINFSNGQIAYAVENFKIGKFPLPKGLVISQISKFNNENFYAEDNLIKVNPGVFPFRISSIKTADNKIQGVATKLDTKMLFQNVDNNNVEELNKQLAIMEQKVQSTTVPVSKEEKDKIKEIKNTIERVKGKSTEQKKKEAEEQRKIKVAALTKILNGLSNAYSRVETSKEQEIISIMLLTVSKMIENTSYDSSVDQASVASIYNTLDADSKNRVRCAIFWSVGGDNIRELKQAFGL
jgi:uncharacterized protein YpmS